MPFPDQLQPDNRPSKTPPRSLDDGSAGGGKDDKKKAAAAAALGRQQQDFLREQREVIARSIKAAADHSKIVRDRFRHILGHVHRLHWRELQPFVAQLRRFPSLSKTGVIVLGGWRHEHAGGELTAPPKPLFDNLFSFAVYREALRRVDHFYRAPSKGSTAELDAVWAWVKKYDWAFSDALDDGDAYTVGRVQDLARREADRLLAAVREALLFFDRRAFVFFPTALDPASGWKDFFDFVWAYDYLPDDIKNASSPHSLLIRLPSPA